MIYWSFEGVSLFSGSIYLSSIYLLYFSVGYILSHPHHGSAKNERDWTFAMLL